MLLEATDDRAVTAGLLTRHRDQDRHPEDFPTPFLDAAANDEARRESRRAPSRGTHLGRSPSSELVDE